MPTFTDFALKSAWAACVAFPVAILVWFATRGIPCVVSWNDVTGFERPSYAPEATTATGCATYDTFVLFPANKAWFYFGRHRWSPRRGWFAVMVLSASTHQGRDGAHLQDRTAPSCARARVPIRRSWGRRTTAISTPAGAMLRQPPGVRSSTPTWRWRPSEGRG
jgi:hypothetical protein